MGKAAYMKAVTQSERLMLKLELASRQFWFHEVKEVLLSHRSRAFSLKVTASPWVQPGLGKELDVRRVKSCLHNRSEWAHAWVNHARRAVIQGPVHPSLVPFFWPAYRWVTHLPNLSAFEWRACPGLASVRSCAHSLDFTAIQSTAVVVRHEQPADSLSLSFMNSTANVCSLLSNERVPQFQDKAMLGSLWNPYAVPLLLQWLVAWHLCQPHSKPRVDVSAESQVTEELWMSKFNANNVVHVKYSHNQLLLKGPRRAPWCFSNFSCCEIGPLGIVVTQREIRLRYRFHLHQHGSSRRLGMTRRGAKYSEDCVGGALLRVGRKVEGGALAKMDRTEPRLQRSNNAKRKFMRVPALKRRTSTQLTCSILRKRLLIFID